MYSFTAHRAIHRKRATFVLIFQVFPKLVEGGKEISCLAEGESDSPESCETIDRSGEINFAIIFITASRSVGDGLKQGHESFVDNPLALGQVDSCV
jgi:hypothetical protein